MDITKLALQDEAEIKIFLPDGTPTDIVFTLCSSETEQYREAAKRLRKARIKTNDQTDYEELEAQSLRFICECIVGWEGLEKDGEPLPFSVDAAVDLLGKHRWLKEVIDRELAKKANFMQR